MKLCILLVNGTDFFETIVLRRSECLTWATQWSQLGFSVWLEIVPLGS